MLDHRANEIVIVEALKDYLSTELRQCEVVRQNQVVEVPPYPYAAYTVTTPVYERGGFFCEAEDGTLYRDVLQTWSFTVQSDDQDEAMTLGLRMFDFFSAVGLIHLADHNITVRKVGNVNNRDNLISIEYEYRKGLDVTFGLLYSIEPSEQPFRSEIENVKFKEE